ncbi:MAG: hypothetical protein V9E85_10225 [Candidatus Nanopelagicales bacterium]
MLPISSPKRAGNGQHGGELRWRAAIGGGSAASREVLLCFGVLPAGARVAGAIHARAVRVVALLVLGFSHFVLLLVGYHREGGDFSLAVLV